MAILLAFLTNLTLTSFISCFILKLNIKNESIKDMNINKKIYNERVARQVFIFHIIYTRLAQMDSLSFGLIITERKI
tara:strand:- start:293 stop:523 length:231 start_codon:yes stop_codon:yes gene_type:complete